MKQGPHLQTRRASGPLGGSGLHLAPRTLLTFSQVAANVLEVPEMNVRRGLFGTAHGLDREVRVLIDKQVALQRFVRAGLV